MKYFEPCTPEKPCGKGHNAYTFNFSKGLAKILYKVLKKHDEKKRPLRVADMDFTNVEYTGWKQLKYFGLIVEIDGDYVEPTPLAYEFYNNLTPIETTVAIIDGKRLGADHPAWITHTRKVKTQYLYEISPEYYKQRHEFQVEKTRQTSIFQML